jgi:rfaE bifunctional protein nucleotidyltransferase chain/domain
MTKENGFDEEQYVTKGKILERRTAAERLEEARRRGRTAVVFTNGCFDLLHAGHVEYLEKARSYGDILVVGINTDASVECIKGLPRPINPLQERASVLAGLACVDFVVPFAEADPLDLIECLRPDVLVKGADWPEDRIVGAPQVLSWGGKVVRVSLRQGISTADIIRRIVQSYCR